MDAFSSAIDIAKAIRSKEVSPVEIADLYLERIERIEPTLNAFSHRADDDVRAAAARAADAVARPTAHELPPFHGVPLPIKNLNPVAGWPCTYGSRGATSAPREESDPIVQRFVDAGFVLLGNDELTGVRHHLLHGKRRARHHAQPLESVAHTWRLERRRGRSSRIGHGADRPRERRRRVDSHPRLVQRVGRAQAGRGRVPNEFIELEGFVSEGVLSRTVADTAALLDVLGVVDPLVFFSAPQPPEPYSILASTPPGRLRIGFTLEAPLGLPVDPECSAAVGATTAALEALGHDVREVKLEIPDMDKFVESFVTIWNTGSAWSPIDDWDAIEPLNAALRTAARAVDSLSFAESVRATQRLARPLIAMFEHDVDVLVTPTMTVLPPRVGAWREG